MFSFFEKLQHEFVLPLENPVLVFSLILFIILLSPIVFRKLKVPGIIVLILSGMLIGPHGFNLLEKNSAVNLFSTIGLLYIMFIAGLDLDLTEFSKNKNKSILFGVFTFIFPLSIGFPVCHYLLHYDFNASLLTASMFSTHTLIAYPIVSKLGISKNQAVAVSVGGTIFTDTAVLVLLAVILNNAQGALDFDFWMTLGISTALFLIIMFFIVPKVTKWFFQKLESEKYAQYIYVLSILFFAAFLAEMAGFESIIGAFFAGLALNKLIPHNSALMNRIEFIGNSLFIPFFLISVGMIVDITIVVKDWYILVIAGVLTTVAILSKWLAAFVTQKTFNYSPVERKLIFGLSSAHAAATLAIILVGYKANILDERILNGTIILILITCIVATINTERAARKIVLVFNDGQNNNSKEKIKKEHILVPLANLENFDKILDLAICIKDKKQNFPIQILSVVPDDSEVESNIISAKQKVQNYIKIGAETETKIESIVTIDVNPTNGIQRIAKESLADIIILGWPKKAGLIDKFVGERIYSIINGIEKNIFVCQLSKPLISLKRVVIITTPHAEVEKGFEIWLFKMMKIAKELHIPIVHFGSRSTQDAIKKAIKLKFIGSKISFKIFDEWKEFMLLTDYVEESDLLVLVAARKSSVSYLNFLEHIPTKIDKHFNDNNKIVIYPE